MKKCLIRRLGQGKHKMSQKVQKCSQSDTDMLKNQQGISLKSLEWPIWGQLMHWNEQR